MVDRWTKLIQDTIADSSGVREGLHDDEAMPLIDWGAARAEQLAARLASPGTPEPTEESVGETAYSLVRLMTRITWVVVYRRKKDAAWLTRTFNKINELSQEVHGPDAPTLTDAEIAAWIAGDDNRTNGELIADLIARLTPQAATASPPEPAAPPGVPDLIARVIKQPAPTNPAEPAASQGETITDDQKEE